MNLTISVASAHEPLWAIIYFGLFEWYGPTNRACSRTNDNYHLKFGKKNNQQKLDKLFLRSLVFRKYK